VAYLQEPLFKPESHWQPPSDFLSLRGCRRISLDVETRDEQLEELGPGVRRGSYIVGLAIGTDDGRRAYYPTRHEGGGNLDEALVKRWAKKELDHFEGEIVGANLLYDMDFLAHPSWGVMFPRVRVFHDVQVAEPLLDEWRREYSLEALAHDYLGEGKRENVLREIATSYGWNTNKEIKKNLWRLHASYVGEYGEGDVDRPLRILPEQLKRLEAEGLMPVYEIERQLIPLLLAMRQRGVRIDVKRAEQVRQKLVQERDELLSRFRRLTSARAEFMAPESFASALTQRGLKFPITPKTLKPSITKEWIERNRADEAVAVLERGRKVNTIITTFIDGHVLGHLNNGRVHCEFHQLKGEEGGTIARFSSSNPNLQNVPARDEELAPLIRGMFIPEEGEEWERQDQSQVEYRLLVNYAVGPGAEEAREKYRNDPKTDYHKMVAEMLGVDPEDKFKRKRVKTTNFAKGYGAGLEKLAATFGCSLEEAAEFIREYEEKLPFAKATYNKAADWGTRRGFVTTVLGRRQRFPLWEPWRNKNRVLPPLPREQALARYGQDIKRAFTYTALNRKLQGSAADLMKKSMVEAHRAGVFGPLGAPLLTVHDELDISVPRTKEAQEAAAELKRISETCITLKVPLIVDAERGKSWGDCK
jgi:DNA polymerase I-like protein with 3'-5' exonuclease and polymerase domains